MATAGQLAETLHLVTKVPLATIVDIDRKLVVAGLRTKSGRGPSAAQMTPADAANILVALLGGPQARASADTVSRYRETQVDSSSSSVAGFGPTGIDELSALKPQHSFIDVIAAMITSASNGDMAALSRGKAASQPVIEIFAFTQATRASVRISGLPNGLTALVEYVRMAKTLPVARRRLPDLVEAGDFEQSRRITQKTIFAIATLLTRESLNE